MVHESNQDGDHHEQPISERIRVARENAGYSIEELAARIGVLPDSVLAWETGEREPRANRMMTLAGVLNVSIVWLIEGRAEDYLETQSVTTLDTLRRDLEQMDLALAELRQQVQATRQRLDVVALRIRRGDAASLI